MQVKQFVEPRPGCALLLVSPALDVRFCARRAQRTQWTPVASREKREARCVAIDACMPEMSR